MTGIRALEQAVMTSLENGFSVEMPSAWLHSPSSGDMVRISLPMRMRDEVILVKVVLMALNAVLREAPVIITIPIFLDADGQLEVMDYDHVGAREMILVMGHLGDLTVPKIYRKRQGIWMEEGEVELPWEELSELHHPLDESSPMYHKVVDVLIEANVLMRH